MGCENPSRGIVQVNGDVVVVVAAAAAAAAAADSTAAVGFVVAAGFGK